MKKIRYSTSIILAIAMIFTTLFSGITAYAEESTPAQGQEQTVKDGSLTGLKLEDSAHWMDESWSFDADTHEYNLQAWLETYGIRFTPEVAGGGSVTVTMSGTQIDTTTTTVNSGESFELNLTQKRHSSTPAGDGEVGCENDCVYQVVIETTTGETYTLNITRPGLQQYVDQFERCEYSMDEIEGAEDGKTMTYWRYVPDDYDPSKEYPVVMYLHGIGQRAVEATDVLLRNAAATAFVYYGKECIVLAPQCNYTDLSVTEQWADGDMNLSIFGEGAYQILQDTKSAYSIDKNREYIVGLSMGGQGTCGMLASYPDEWAGALINAAPYSTTEEGLEKLVAAIDEVPTWLCYATDDNSVPYESSHDVLIPALDKAGVDYKCTVVTEDEYLAPMRHFCWAIQWANEDVLDWLLSQTNDLPEDGTLTGLKLEDSAHWMDDSWSFDSNTYNYDLDAWLETYGVRFTPTVEGGGDVTVTMSGTQIETTTTTVKSGESFELNLTQKRHSSTPAGDAEEGIENECSYKVVIETTTGETYTLNITRPGLQQYVDQFDRCEYSMDEIEGAEDGKTMTYWRYVPDDYDPSKEYPVVMYLHGVGQRAVEATDVLLRNAAATAFVYYGKECIVLAPQCNYSDLSVTEQWADGDMKLSIFGEGAYQILQDTKNDYNIDSNREYIVGLSMGGQGTCGMLASYPDEWAGALINAAPYSTTEEGLKKLVAAIDEVPTWLCYATDDNSVPYESSHDVLIPALDAAGVDYKCTVITEDEYLAPMRHFCWAVQWADEDVLDWLLSQEKSGYLTNLEMEDPAQLATLDFNENTKEYNVTVFEDVYGLRFTPTITTGAPITVTTSGSGIAESTFTVENGEQFELKLSQTRECTGGARSMEDDCDYKVVIEADNGTYTINVHRPGTDALVNQFQRCTYTMSNGKDMTYWLYVPADYDPSKKYPVVITPHGGGQFAVDAEDILVRTAQATTFAKYGKDCIVIAPHGNYTDLSNTESYTRAWADDDLTLSPFCSATIDILKYVESKYSVDTNKVSVAGASQGGRAAVALVANYPEIFAAAVVGAPAFTTLTSTTTPTVTDTIKESAAKFAKVVKENNIAVWLVQAETDPTVNIQATYTLKDALDAIDADYNITVYEKGTYLSPSDHFSWVPFFDNEENLDWLLDQSRTTQINEATVSAMSTKTYTGKSITQKIKVVMGETTLKEGTDYKVTYKNNKNIGKATVTITGIGKYEGTITKSFKIIPKTPKISYVKAGKKYLKVKVGTVKGGVKYQIAYKYAKSWKTVSTSKYNYKLKKLKSGKKYYVKVRAYKKVSGKTYYSSWSKAKAAKVK